jgi:hypothetical protein
MRAELKLLALAALLSTPACSDSSNPLAIQDLIDTMEDCFPGVNDKVEELLEIAGTWRMNSSVPIADPPGLTWMEQGDGSVAVTYTVGFCTFTATIVFYTPDGMAQDLDLSLATTLNEAIDAAATQLALITGNGANPPPFMVADWDLVGVGIDTFSGSGALTGFIRGNSDPLLNELESISTTTAMPSGGAPPGADGVVTSTSGATTCTLNFNTMNLETDTMIDQQFPIGTITFMLDGPDATVDATMTFDGTMVATIEVDNVPGDFSLDLVTGQLDYNP